MAAVLGFVGAGGLGQLLYFHLSIFQQAQASTALLAMFVLVVGVDALERAAAAGVGAGVCVTPDCIRATGIRSPDAIRVARNYTPPVALIERFPPPASPVAWDPPAARRLLTGS